MVSAAIHGSNGGSKARFCAHNSSSSPADKFPFRDTLPYATVGSITLSLRADRHRPNSLLIRRSINPLYTLGFRKPIKP